MMEDVKSDKDGIARYKRDDPTTAIQNWMRNRGVIEFLGLWERLHNPDFKPRENGNVIKLRQKQ